MKFIRSHKVSLKKTVNKSNIKTPGLTNTASLLYSKIWYLYYFFILQIITNTATHYKAGKRQLPCIFKMYCENSLINIFFSLLKLFGTVKMPSIRNRVIFSTVWQYT